MSAAPKIPQEGVIPVTCGKCFRQSMTIAPAPGMGMEELKGMLRSLGYSCKHCGEPLWEEK